jgi:dTDP-4-dehydrorhamnose 3,5-epimerase
VIFRESPLRGCFVIEPEAIRDERGFFARSWCRAEAERYGLVPDVAQCNISFNDSKGTLRGMHYQAEPHPEAKLVRCTRGSLYDVVVDLRGDSPTFRQWFAVDLTADDHRMVYVPAGMAHGFQTLEDGTEVFYQMSTAYVAELARGVRWNDPAFAITWPLPNPILSERDRSYPDWP